MHASAVVHAARAAASERDGPAGPPSRLVRVTGRPPLAPRITGERRVHLVNAAAGPLPGDLLELDIDVAAGATLLIGATGATIALPGPDLDAPPSRQHTRARVHAGATLAFLGEPLVGAAGCRHVATTEVELAAGARLIWRELIVPGRSGEPSGDLDVALTVRRDELPVLDQRLRLGPAAPGAHGPAGLAGARCAGGLVVAGFGGLPADAALLGQGAGGGDVLAALLPLAAAGCGYATALGDAAAVRRALAEAVLQVVDDDELATELLESW